VKEKKKVEVEVIEVEDDLTEVQDRT